MSIIVEMRDLERELEQLQARLETLRNNEAVQHTLEFESKLRDLMQKYDLTPAAVLEMLSGGKKPVATPVRATKKVTLDRRTVLVEPMVFRNPFTNEEVSARRINNQRIQEWIKEHGKLRVMSWQVQDRG